MTSFRATPEPAHKDDPQTIPNHHHLYRVLYQENWSVPHGSGRRVSSHAFKDTLTFAASCFVAEETNLESLCERFPGKRIAVVIAAAVRAAQHIIARDPDGDDGNPTHVVICPPGGLKRSTFDRLCEEISSKAQVLPDPNQSRDKHR